MDRQIFIHASYIYFFNIMAFVQVLIPLIYFAWNVAAQSTCSCPIGLPVCGTDGVTYKSICALNLLQPVNKALGMKCFGSCPCPPHSEFFMAVSRRICARQEGFSFLPPVPVCLTNGTTTKSCLSARCAVALPESPADLGVRCVGECSKCSSSPPCPVFQFGSSPSAPADGQVQPNPPAIPDFATAIQRIFA